MYSFFGSCVKCSKIIIHLFDTITSANLKPEQSSFLMSLYVLQVLSDLHKPLGECYLREVDKDQDDVLICYVFHIASSASENTRNFMKTKADAFLASLDIDKHKNVKASFTIDKMFTQYFLIRGSQGGLIPLIRQRKSFQI